MNQSMLHDAGGTFVLASKPERECLQWASAKPCEAAALHATLPTRPCQSA